MAVDRPPEDHVLSALLSGLGVGLDLTVGRRAARRPARRYRSTTTARARLVTAPRKRTRRGRSQPRCTTRHDENVRAPLDTTKDVTKRWDGSCPATSVGGITRPAKEATKSGELASKGRQATPSMYARCGWAWAGVCASARGPRWRVERGTGCGTWVYGYAGKVGK